MTTDTKNELTIVRVLDAPRDKVWRACRDREALREWWGQPKGATMPFCEVDFRVGGISRFGCEFEGREIWVKGVYRKIVEGETLVIEQHMTDSAGRELNSPTWPASMITLRLEDLGHKTKLTVTHADMASEENPIERFQEGWSQSLDRLAESLARG
jgi:uncharacterized protein YndB with AHSA1/START domain